MTAGADHPYRGRRAGLATQHGKVPLVGPALARHVGLEVVEVAVDTDTLGTFAGEVPRPGSPWETAVAKARLGMRASGLPLGLASEGSFGAAEGLPFLQADTELVVLVDDDLGIEIGEVEVRYGVPAIGVEVPGGRVEDVPLDRAGFPEHGLIVRPADGWAVVRKGIHDLDELQSAMLECARLSDTGHVRVETDLRAHHHPTRCEVIAQAAERLAVRLAAQCPGCRAPGWGVARREPGARCSECGVRTRLPKCEYLTCAACGAEEARPVNESGGVDPRYCPRCNP